jgi:hypothetical protein
MRLVLDRELALDEESDTKATMVSTQQAAQTETKDERKKISA